MEPEQGREAESVPGPTPQPEPVAGRTITEMRFGHRVYKVWVAPVDLEKINVSPARQRTLSRPRVDEIKKKFNPLAVLIVISHRPDGGEFLVGGHHCSTAAYELGSKVWPFGIHAECIDETEEAQLYADLLDVRRPNAPDWFNAQIHAGNPVVLAHIRTLERANRGWSKKRRKEDWNHFATLKPTMSIEARVGSDQLVHQLNFANACWEGQKEVCHNDVVRGIYYFFRDWQTVYGKFPEERIIDTLRGQRLRAFINGIRNAPFHRSSSEEGRGITFARILAEFYNEHAKGHKLWHISALEPTTPSAKG
jgi:hypothetical protein